MKKLITLCLALAGMVGTVSATKLYVNVDNIDWWPNDNAKVDFNSWTKNGDVESDNTGWDNHIIIEPTYMFGGKWYVYEMPNGNNRAIVRRNVNNSLVNQTWDITVENDYFIYLKDKGESKLGWDVVSAPSWTGLCVRSSVDGYDGYTNNMECSDDKLTFTKTYTKSQLENATNFTFRLKHIENVVWGEDGIKYNTWTNIGPSTNDEGFDLPGTLTTQHQFSDETGNNWKITLPTYDYEKIVITAKYVESEGTYSWKVSADAYISKTVSAANEYATFGTSVPVDLSGLSAKGVTAYTVTADGTTRAITKNEKSDALAANEGVLLKNTTNSDVTLSIPVAASATASASNSMVAFTGTGKLTQPGGNETYYILANEGDGVGFYKVNKTYGNAMGTNTAYLKVTGSLARPYLWFDEATGIDAVESVKMDGEAYNLAGQRVAQPTKGLYIVNGKKVIMK